MTGTTQRQPPSRTVAAVLLGLLGQATAITGLVWAAAQRLHDGAPLLTSGPPRLLVAAGAALVVAAGTIGTLLARRAQGRLPRAFPLAVAGGALCIAALPAAGAWAAGSGDPLLWHPAALLAISGGALTAAALWLALAEAGLRPRDGRSAWALHALVATLLLVALTTVGLEHELGLPRLRLLAHPVLLTGASTLVLVAARIALGTGGALAVALLHLALRSGLWLALDAAGTGAPRPALLLGVAASAELAALLVRPPRPVPVALVAGAAAGTLGLAVEWVWVGMVAPYPWDRGLLPDAVLLALIAAVGAALLGAALGGAVAGDTAVSSPIVGGKAPSWVFTLAGTLALVGAVAAPLPYRGDLRPQVGVTVHEDENGVTVDAVIGPPDAPDGAHWFELAAFGDGGLHRAPLYLVNPSVYRSLDPLPIGDDATVVVRLHRDATLLEAVLQRPASATPAPGDDAGSEEFDDPFGAEPGEQRLRSRFVTLRPPSEEPGGGSGRGPALVVVLLAAAGAAAVTRAAASLRRPDGDS